MTQQEEERAAELREAQSKAERLFDEIETHGLIRAGISESRLNEEIYELAEKMYGITTYWHKRIVRAGKNTLAPYAENPPDLMIGVSTGVPRRSTTLPVPPGAAFCLYRWASRTSRRSPRRRPGAAPPRGDRRAARSLLHLGDGGHGGQ